MNTVEDRGYFNLSLKARVLISLSKGPICGCIFFILVLIYATPDYRNTNLVNVLLVTGRKLVFLSI